MRQPKVFVGMACFGDMAAFTARSLVDLGRQFEPHQYQIGVPIVGSLLEHALAELTDQFIASDCDVFLRIDADSTWNPAWSLWFHRTLSALWRPGGDPLILGGVVPKRRKSQFWAPAFSLVEGTPLHQPDNRLYAAWVYQCYLKGALVHAHRVGGAYTAFSREAIEVIGPEGWQHTYGPPGESHRGLGEDYLACEAVAAAGGRCYVLFPRRGGAEINHWNGTELIGLEDFLNRARAGGIWPEQVDRSEVSRSGDMLLHEVTQ